MKISLIAVFIAASFPGLSAAHAASIINPQYDHQYDNYVLVSPEGFTHPGILHSRADLNLIRDKVQQGCQPWSRAFEAFRRDPHSLLTYKMTGPDANIGSVAAGYKLITDGDAAYNLAIMWYITGDPAYSTKAIQILEAWSATANSNATDRIRHGIAALRLMSAAEILRYTPSSGWTDADTKQFKSFAQKFPPAIDITNGFMNQGGYAAMGSMAVAIFTDDVPYYQRIVNRVTVGDNPDPLRDIAMSRQIYPTGQVSEMGRDEPHAAADVNTLSMIAQTMLIQGPKISNGIDLFDYLDGRLLLGAEYYTKFNTGYDVDWSPKNSASTGKGAYDKISYNGRGRTVAYDLIYNHYKYIKGVPDSALTYVKAIRDRVMERESDDFPGYGALLFSQPKAQEDAAPVGPPQEIKITFVDPRFQRFSAAQYSKIPIDCYAEYFSDADGTRPYISGALHHDWAEYDDFDFGKTPVDKFYISSGNNSSVGNLIDIHLDSLTGPIIGTVPMPGTGWYTTFRTGVAALTQPLSGKHTIVLQQHGSNNVYKLEGALEWLKVAHGSAHEPNPAAINDGTGGTSLVGNDTNGQAVSFTEGGFLKYRDMDFDNGSLTLSLHAATTSSGELQLRRSSATGELIATYSLPDTKGAWQTLSLPHIRDSIFGRNDVALVYTGKGTLLLDTFQYGPGMPPSPLVDGVDYRAIISGNARRANAKTGRTYADIEGGTTLVYELFRTRTDPKLFAIRVASHEPGTITLTFNDRTSAPFATIAVPNTSGKSVWLKCDASGLKTKVDGLLFLTFDHALQLDSYQFDPPNFVEEN